MDYTATWKTGIFAKADCSKVTEEIKSIGESATAEQILEKAKDPKTELHKCFDWDDTEAATKWRLHQARMVVCEIVYVEKKPQAAEPIKVRVFNRIDNSGYKETTKIFRNPDEYSKLLSNAKAELLAFERKYKTLTELDELFDVIHQLTA